MDEKLATRGHFLYESGHHGDLWLDLDALFLDASGIRDWARALAQRAKGCNPELVCGPMVGGAFLALMLAQEMGAGFLHAERLAAATVPVRYGVPPSLHAVLPGRRILLVDDAISAGSALRSTLEDVKNKGGELVGIASLLVLGDAGRHLAEQEGVPLYALAALESGLWAPEECPLCEAGVPLTEPLAMS